MTRNRSLPALRALLARLAPLAALLLAPLAACGPAAEPPARAAAEEVTEPEPEPPQAWLEFDRDSEDFGDVYASAVRNTTFALVAAGEEDLVLGELRRTCGCTEGELMVVGEDGTETLFEPGRPYPPGTRFTLYASLNTKGRQGPQEQRVHVDVEGQALPTSFTLTAEIVTFLEMDPPQLAITGASTLEGAEGELVVKSRGGEHFAVDVRRDVLPPELEVDFEPLEPDAEGRAARWSMSFRIAPGVPKGPYKRKLIFVTDAVNEEAEPMADGAPAVHMGELWIRTDVSGVFDVRPERLNFARIAPGQGVVKKVVVRSRDEEFDLSSIDVALFERSGEPYAHASAFQLEKAEIEPGRAWEVEIKVEDFPVAGQFGGLLGIRTLHPMEPEIVIQFIGQSLKPE